MQMKACFAHTSESEKPGLGKTPEAFNSVDVAFAMYEFILSMVDPEVLFISQIHEPIIPSPAIGMDDTFKAQLWGQVLKNHFFLEHATTLLIVV